MRSDAPAQCVVVPPTVLQIQAGRFGKSLATRQLPEVVRLSSQASCRNEFHSSLMKSQFVDPLAGLEQHDRNALLAELVGERAAAGAGADHDHDRIVVEVIGGHGPRLSQSSTGGLASGGGSGSQPRSSKPRSM